MVAGIDTFLMREIDRSVAERSKFWQRDFASRAAYEKSVQPNRERLQKATGAVDPRLPVTGLEIIRTTRGPAQVAETTGYRVHEVRWPVFEGVWGEGLWLQPTRPARAKI